MSRRIGLVVEGRDDKEVIKKIFKKLHRLPPKVRNAKNNGNLRRKIKPYQELLSRNCNKIIVLKDLNSANLNELQNEIKPKLYPNANFCVAVQSIESWILADNQALTEVIGKTIKPIHNPEKIRKPKDEIIRIFRHHGRKYIASRDLPELADKMRLSIVRKRCPSFRRFEEALKDC